MKTFLPLLLLAGASLPLHGADPIEFKLWPEGPPGKMLPHSQATDDFIRTKAGKGTITDIHDPTLTVYRPEKPNGTSVIVAPGGGYVFLSAIHEGVQVCEWLNTLGVTAVLLKYRTPTRDEPSPHLKPVEDAAKAIDLVRLNAKGWKLDPQRVGLLGFSAGGNLLAHLTCDPSGPIVFTSEVFGETPQPNFGIMIYGGGWLDPKDPTKLQADFTVPTDAPPMFIACAHDDGQNPIAATALYLEYKRHNLPAELHLFTKGGHGFGMRRAGNPINDWPQRCAEWLASMDLLSKASSLKAQIKKIEETLELFHKVTQAKLPAFECGNDLAEFNNLKRRAEEARTAGRHEEAAIFEEKHRVLSEWMKKPRPPSDIKIDTLNADMVRLKKDRIQLEAELKDLLKSKPASSSP